MSKNSDDPMIFVAGTLFGIITGVIAGLALSPKSGREMRKEIVKKVSSDSIVRVKYTIENQINKINDALKAGRMAAAKRKEEMESGYQEV